SGYSRFGSNNGMLGSPYNAGGQDSYNQGYGSSPPYTAPGSTYGQSAGYDSPGEPAGFDGQAQQQGAYPDSEDRSGGLRSSGTSDDDQAQNSNNEYQKSPGKGVQSANSEDIDYQGSVSGMGGKDRYDEHEAEGTSQHPGSDAGAAEAPSGKKGYDDYEDEGTSQDLGSNSGSGKGSGKGSGGGEYDEHDKTVSSEAQDEESGSGRNDLKSEADASNMGEEEDQRDSDRRRPSNASLQSANGDDSGYDTQSEEDGKAHGDSQSYRSSTTEQRKRTVHQRSKSRDLHSVTPGGDEPSKRESYHVPIKAGVTTLTTYVKRPSPTTNVDAGTPSAVIATVNFATPPNDITPLEAVARAAEVDSRDHDGGASTHNDPRLNKKREPLASYGQTDPNSNTLAAGSNGNTYPQGDFTGGSGTNPNTKVKTPYGSAESNDQINSNTGRPSYSQPGYNHAPAQNSGSQSGNKNAPYQTDMNQRNMYNDGSEIGPGTGSGTSGQAIYGDTGSGRGGNVQPASNSGPDSRYGSSTDNLGTNGQGSRPYTKQGGMHSDDQDGGATGEDDEAGEDGENGENGGNDPYGQSGQAPPYQGSRLGYSGVPNSGGDSRYGTGKEECDETQYPGSCDSSSASPYATDPDISQLRNNLPGSLPSILKLSNPFGKSGGKTTDPETPELNEKPAQPSPPLNPAPNGNSGGDTHGVTGQPAPISPPVASPTSPTAEPPKSTPSALDPPPPPTPSQTGPTPTDPVEQAKESTESQIAKESQAAATSPKTCKRRNKSKSKKPSSGDDPEGGGSGSSGGKSGKC
ncbi:hypothetical protein LTR78_010892, partial [Recurvomyces mirabilis]